MIDYSETLIHDQIISHYDLHHLRSLKATESDITEWLRLFHKNNIEKICCDFLKEKNSMKEIQLLSIERHDIEKIVS